MNLCFSCVLLLLATPALAAPCDQGFLLKQGTVTEMTSFTPAHQPMAKIVATIVSSVSDGNKVTAVQTVDTYTGANRVSTSTVDVVCDGKTVSLAVRNADAMKNWYIKAASDLAKTGGKLLNATIFSEPQVYPLDMKIGSELPPYRAFSIVEMRKAPPDWDSIIAKDDWMKALAYALNNKGGGGSQLVTMNAKVVGQESCAIPGGPNVPCFRITKEKFSKGLDGNADLKQDFDVMAKGARLQPITEWFAPGIGVVRLEINITGRAIISMALTSLKR